MISKVKNKKVRTNKGITLIALVITIIVLLILAGVTIATLSGPNGILTQANDSKTKTEIAEEKEAINLAMQALLIDKVNNPDDYQEGIINNIQLKKEMDKSTPKPQEITMNETTNELTVIYDESRNNRTYIVDQMGKIGESAKREGIKVGDYVDYKYDESEDYVIPDDIEWQTGEDDEEDNKIARQSKDEKWRILKIYDDGRVDLISEGRVSPTIGISKDRMGNGYNNAIFILNDICEKFYSNKALGIKARSINLEDIESQMKEEKVNEYKNSYNNGIASYGDVKVYDDSYRYYPKLYAQENGSGIGLDVTGKTEEEIKALLKRDGIDRSEVWYDDLTRESSERKSNLIVTQTYYELNDVQEEDFINKEAYDLIFTDSYWVASRFVNCVEAYSGKDYAYEYAEFGMYGVINNTVRLGGLMELFNSYQGGYTGNYSREAIRPIVTLNQDIKINLCTGENSRDNMHTISK